MVDSEKAGLRIERNCKHTSEETSDSPANQTSDGAHQHAFLSSNIQHSTFHHQPKAGGPPFLSRTGNVLHASHLQGFCILPFHKRIFHFIPAILMGLHSPMNPGSYSPASAQDTHTCEPSDAHGQQTKFATLRPPFFQERSFVFCFSFGKTFASLAFIRKHSALRRQSPQDFTAPSRRLIFHTPFPVPLSSQPE